MKNCKFKINNDEILKLKLLTKTDIFNLKNIFFSKIKLDKLINLVKYSKQYYYFKNMLLIDDLLYDKLIFFLKNKINYSDSIGYSVINDCKKIKLKFPMLSIKSIRTVEEISLFIKNKQKKNSDLKFIIQPKIDGVAVGLDILITTKDNINTYNLLLYSRGNGIIGENLNNLLKKKLINFTLNDNFIQSMLKLNINQLVLRGELCIRRDIYKKFKLYNFFSNERTFVISLLRNKYKLKTDYYKILDIIWYDIKYPHLFNNYSEKIIFLKKYNFNTIISDNFEINSVVHLNKILQEKKQKSLFLLDGLVIKINSNISNIQNNIKFSNEMIAFKENSEVVKAVVGKTQISVGRTGLISFIVLLLNKIKLKNRFISKIKTNNFYDKGEIVYLELRNEIIPYIITKKSIKKKILYCPYCFSKLITYKKCIFCVNYCCYDKMLRVFDFFFKKYNIKLTYSVLKKVIICENFHYLQTKYFVLNKTKWNNVNGITQKFVNNIALKLKLLLNLYNDDYIIQKIYEYSHKNILKNMYINNKLFRKIILQIINFS